jgi:hypothetical protein
MKRISASLFVAVALGLAWAMRGHFGHEWGAAWAGATGVLALLLVSGRRDWARRAPVLAALGAIGWGAGGMMSYGIVVGYCRSISFPNALYGYTMLAVIGGLYGFGGGGLLGLGLESSKEKRPDWPRLMAEMVAGGILSWGLLIYQMEWLMTPPRSELWAALLGAILALAWYLARNGFHRALRTAVYTALGAGTGFALGNFFQTLGTTSGIAYNWWNVMEFTLGFCGGLGMAYAVLTRDWPESETPTKTGLWIAAAVVFLFLPFSNMVNGMSTEHFLEKAGRLGLAGAEAFATRQMWITGSLVILFAVTLFLIWEKWGNDPGKTYRYALPMAFFLVALEYNLFSYIQLITFRQPINFGHSETLYIFFLAALFLTWFINRKKEMPLPRDNDIPETGRRWMMILGLLVVLLLIITLISVNIHGELPGAHNRF